MSQRALLTPLGSFFAQLEAGDIELPWASILGFADVLAVILVAIWLARRHQTRRAHTPSREPTGVEPPVHTS
jgi:flagellar biogenesis protein FliO